MEMPSCSPSTTPLIGIEVTEEAIFHFLLVFYVKLREEINERETELEDGLHHC
jgi:hypothetical protein